LSQTSEFASESLQHSPCGILALDDNRQISWVNPALEQLLGLPGTELIGKSQETLAHPTYTGLFGDPGLMQLIGDSPRDERWLQCSQVQTNDTQAPGKTLKFFQDVTELMQLRQENERLRQQVEELTITDSLTGLANRRALTNSLNAQVTRSRRYQNPLSLVALELVDDSRPAAEIEPETILTASRFLRDRLRWVDVIGRWDHNQFFIILPETEEAHGLELLNNIVSEFPASNPDMATSLHLQFGLAEWQKGCDSRKLMQLAADAMQQIELTE
jgi:diguanylate cyclase (GGDEF)-like protein